MKLLLDACVGTRTLAALRARGHDAERIEDDAGDAAILERALREERVLITADKDFGALVFARGQLSHGVLRVVDHPLAREPAVVVEAVERYRETLQAGALVVVEPWRVRVRQPPSDPP